MPLSQVCTDDCLVVLINYARPHNMKQVIDMWRQQTTNLVVVDNSPRKPLLSEERYPNPIFERADDVWRMRTNHGCPCRFAPVMFYDCKYVLFADDDLIPGKYALDYLLTLAYDLKDKFSTIGQFGRRFDLSAPYGKRYRSHNFRKSGETLSQVDLTCRAHLWLSWNLEHVLRFKTKLRSLGEDVTRLTTIHDDMLLGLGCQLHTGYPSYVLGEGVPQEQLLIKQNLTEETELGQPGGVWRRPGHFLERDAFIDAAMRIGWSSLVRE